MAALSAIGYTLVHRAAITIGALCVASACTALFSRVSSYFRAMPTCNLYTPLTGIFSCVVIGSIVCGSVLITLIGTVVTSILLAVSFSPIENAIQKQNKQGQEMLNVLFEKIYRERDALRLQAVACESLDQNNPPPPDFPIILNYVRTVHPVVASSWQIQNQECHQTMIRTTSLLEKHEILHQTITDLLNSLAENSRAPERYTELWLVSRQKIIDNLGKSILALQENTQQVRGVVERLLLELRRRIDLRRVVIELNDPQCPPPLSSCPR